MTIAERLQWEVGDLSETLQKEVYDFVCFLKQRHPEEVVPRKRRWAAPDGRPWSEVPEEERDRMHREGYEKYPVQPDEFAVHEDDEFPSLDDKA